MQRFLLLLTMLILAGCGVNGATQPPTMPPPIETPTPEPTAEPSATPGERRADIYLIALEDAGEAGDEIGCGDSVVPAEIIVPPGEDALQTALETLLDAGTEFYGQSGLYNALWQSDVSIQGIDVEPEDDLAVVTLSGDLRLSGACDNPRVAAQLEYTITQFDGINEADVFIDGVLLEEYLSEQ